VIHFNEGDKSPYLPPNLEIAVTGDFSSADTVLIREVGSTLPLMGFQAIFLSTGESV
jgi:hypothetical protein